MLDLVSRGAIRMDLLVQSISHWNLSLKTHVRWVQNVAEHHLVEATFFVLLKPHSLSCWSHILCLVAKSTLSNSPGKCSLNNSTWPEGHDGQGDVHVTFHRLLWSILNVCLPRKTKKIQKKGIWSFLKHLTLTFYLSKVTKTIFPQLIFGVKFLALFKSAVKNRGSHLRKGSYLHLTLKIYLKVKIDSTVKFPPRSWLTFLRTIFSLIKYFRRYLWL